MALDSLGNNEAQKLIAQSGNRAAGERTQKASKKGEKRLAPDEAPDAREVNLALIREIEAEASEVAPALVDFEKTLRHLVGRHLSQELPHEAVIGVLSAKAGEGRTTIALGLAAALAEIYASVVLVEMESDGVTPTLSSEMVISARQGLRDYLDNRASLDSILWQTHKENLWLLPAGPLRQTQSSQLDATARTKQLLLGLSQRFEVVVVDLPPLLTSEAAPALLTGLTGIVLIASAGTTTTEELKQVLDLCRPLPVKGVLLNQVRLRAPRWLASLFRS